MLGYNIDIFKNMYLFTCLCQVLVVASGIFNCGMWTLHCGTRNLLPQPSSPALGAQSLSCRTTREVPQYSPWLSSEGQRPEKDIIIVQLLSHVWFFVTPWTAACQAYLSFTFSWSLCKLMSIELVMPSKHLIFYCPLLLLSSIFPGIRVFSNESALQIRWPKYWNFSFSISSSSEYSELISFRIDWFDLLAVQGTLKSLF